MRMISINCKKSIFSKDELPTWGEMIVCYNGRIFSHSKAKKGEKEVLDRYWKIPRGQYLISMMCNQLNRMVLEEGYELPKIELNGHMLNNERKISGLRFYCHYVDEKDFKNPDCPIYTILHPETLEQSLFITNDIRRFVVNELGNLEIYMVVLLEPKGKYSKNYQIIDKLDYQYNRILDHMFKPYVEYFKDPVGW